MEIWNKIKEMTSPYRAKSEITDESWPLTTWGQIRSRSNCDSKDSNDTNGFVFSGVTIPEVALESILSWVPPQDILTLSKVCCTWKDVTTRKSFWKLVCRNNGVNWEGIPQHIKERDMCWMVFYVAATYRIFQKNLVQNPCGYDGFEHWKRIRNGGDRMKVESPPEGISAMPLDPWYPVESAFVTSFDWCSLAQKIDLRESGLSRAVMLSMLPFQFVCSELVGARFDCGGLYRLTVSLEDDKGNVILKKMCQNLLRARSGWTRVSVSLIITEDDAQILRSKNVRYLSIRNDGKDCCWWAGQYGTKFSRISLQLKCLMAEEAGELLAKAETECAEIMHPELEDEISELDLFQSSSSSDDDDSDFYIDSESDDAESVQEIVTDSDVEVSNESDKDVEVPQGGDLERMDHS